MAKEKISLTMDQLENVSGGRLDFQNKDYLPDLFTPHYYCKNCSKHWNLEDITTGSCPNCQSTDLELRTEED